VFTLSARGRALLLPAPWSDALEAVAISLISLACFAAGTCGWILRAANRAERTAMILAGVLMIYGSGLTLGVGAVLAVVTVGLHAARKN
jgi:TRAP-type uncharacterized transport system fused permease subunit